MLLLLPRTKQYSSFAGSSMSRGSRLMVFEYFSAASKYTPVKVLDVSTREFRFAFPRAFRVSSPRQGVVITSKTETALSFLGGKYQLNHWTNWAVSTQLITLTGTSKLSILSFTTRVVQWLSWAFTTQERKKKRKNYHNFVTGRVNLALQIRVTR